MKFLIIYFLAAGLMGVGVQVAAHSEECVFERLNEKDAQFCRGDLEVLYPELGDVGCTFIPKCNQYRQQISTEWTSPNIRYRQAVEEKKYVLIMVDPDAPNRANPEYRFWRHWVVVGIKGADLKKGDPKGHVLTDYQRPTPPPNSGYHRYQFLLYEQPGDETIYLNPEKSASLGSWDMESFVDYSHLGTPVASTQFITKNYKN